MINLPIIFAVNYLVNKMSEKKLKPANFFHFCFKKMMKLIDIKTVGNWFTLDQLFD